MDQLVGGGQGGRLLLTPRQDGLLVSKFDNLGYKKLGRNPSYVQYTMRLWKDFTEEEVTAAGVPIDTESLMQRVARRARTRRARARAQCGCDCGRISPYK